LAPASKTDGRRLRSERTRAVIVAGARRRFLANGYVATTIEDVATEADVAIQTIYYVFGTKPKLLAAVLDTSIAGDTDSLAVIDRPWIDDLRSSPDATTAITRLTSAAVEIVTRAAPIYEVVRQASADAEVGALLDETRRRRRRDQRHLIEILAAAGHLPAGVDVDAAADVLYALINEEIVRLLVNDCGWSTARLTTWVTDALIGQLLEGRAAPTPRPREDGSNRVPTSPRKRRGSR
jgi:AcrR family transcriptional regulator